MNNTDIYQKEFVWDHGVEQAAPAHPQWLPIALVAGIVALLLVGIGSFYLGGLGKQAPSPGSDMARERGQIQDFLSRAKWALAAALAESALSQQSPPPSAEARSALSALWYAAEMEGLFSTSLPMGQEDLVGRQVALRWLTIEQKADELRIPKTDRLSAIQVAHRSYSQGIWPLADIAFRRAWETGNLGIDAVAFRSSTLRNWGWNLTFRGTPQTKEEGARLLETSCAIAATYNLPNREACGDLERLRYSDYTKVPADPAEPVLAGKR